MVQVGRVKLRATAAEEGELAIAVVRHAAADLSQNQARKLFATGKVYVDDRPCLAWQTRLAKGAVLTVDTDRRNPRRVPQLGVGNVLYRDPSIVVVNKPPGLVSVPPTRTREATLLDLLNDLFEQRSWGAPLAPLHRLDRETSGLMLFGVAGAELGPLRHQFQHHAVHREYYALVEGQMAAADLRGTIDVSRSDYGGESRRQFARTEVAVVDSRFDRTLVRCRPHTGRYHQLRIQLAAAGHPIVGERQHLPPRHKRAIRFPGLALQSCFLAFHHPADHRSCQWELPLDPRLARLLS